MAIKESDSFREGHRVYMLENDNHKLISMVSSYGFNSMKILQVSFFPENPDPIEKMNVEKIIVNYKIQNLCIENLNPHTTKPYSNYSRRAFKLGLKGYWVRRLVLFCLREGF